ncbi:hypothetical protein HGRIS_012667 [Hohenbuehelia grisea]|uniref:Uncharacterized protein n=1 Tax=Hohenbuehelia grisea TaxID=104357 RepID=A0ABR3ISZ9_9AGAR
MTIGPTSGITVYALTLGTQYPPFPDDVPRHPLFVVDYTLVKAGDEQELNKLWEAATRLGFW